tara:strand:- start:239 stop:541 length:303 start_codon:yes stop_codon:yes gene_type:complete
MSFTNIKITEMRNNHTAKLACAKKETLTCQSIGGNFIKKTRFIEKPIKRRLLDNSRPTTKPIKSGLTRGIGITTKSTKKILLRHLGFTANKSGHPIPFIN